LLIGLLMVVGCVPQEVDQTLAPKGGAAVTYTEPVPSPIDLLLPKEMEIHPFTQPRSFSDGTRGIHARVRMLDSFGAETRAFGNFRFELYAVQPYNQDPKGKRIGLWEINLSEPEQNLLHWDRHTRGYEFKLGMESGLPIGQEVILVSIFTSRFTPRLMDERKIVAGR
jgi:hypothetical protein